MSQLFANLNDRSTRLCRELSGSRLRELDIVKIESLLPAHVYDFGTARRSTIRAGVLLAEICTAGLATIEVDGEYSPTLQRPVVRIATDQPIAACIAAQYAGWQFLHKDFFAICSGPARLVRGREELLEQYELSANSQSVAGVFECARLPDRSALEHFANECSTNPENVTLCVASTSSLPGRIQVIARSIETTMHKLQELGFDLRLVERGTGRAPLAPDTTDDLLALGWTNDAILYGGDVELEIDGDDELITSIGDQIPACSSPDFGTPFLKTFEKYERDFFRIDKMLFSPARVTLKSLVTGNEFTYGEIREDILRDSFSMETRE